MPSPEIAVIEMPWLDRSPVKSIRYKGPIFKWALTIWVIAFLVLGYLGTVGLAFVLYPPNGLSQKGLGWAGLGVGAFITLFALWLLVNALNGSAGMSGFGGMFQIKVGIGAILNILAGVTVAAGGFLKAREEKLI